MFDLENFILDETTSKYKLMAIESICEDGRGRVISNDYIVANHGEFPVYSSQTTNEGIFGYINTYDFEGEYITWTTDGVNAGTVVLDRNGKFSCTNLSIRNSKSIKIKFYQ
ncbi:MAG: restriction endonuclease subunit S [Ruminococcus sp.]